MERIMKSKDFNCSKLTINLKMRGYSEDPYVLRKAEDMKAFLKTVGIPADLLKIRAKRLKK